MKNSDYEKINQELVAKIQAANPCKREILLTKLLSFNHGLIANKTNAYITAIYYADLISVAKTALYKAAENYKAGSVSFGLFASTKISQSVTDELRSHSRTVQIDYRRLKAISACLDNGEYVDNGLATELSLDRDFNDDEKYNAYQIADDTEDALSSLIRLEQVEHLLVAMEKLDQGEKEIITRRFVNNETLQSIGSEKGYTAQVARYFEDKAKKRLIRYFKTA